MQQAIEDKLVNSPNLEDRMLESDNKKFTDFAFDSHVKAYEDAGVLGLSVMDKVQVLLTPKPEDLFSDRGLAQAAAIAKDQAWYYLKNPLFAGSQLSELDNKWGEIQGLVRKYIRENQKFFNEVRKQNPQHWSNPEAKIMGLIRDMIYPSFIF
ncbi:MAG: hypothetical protein IT249_19400 [Chitinophagaceae bacterium]|nr:hypothetical protein [Chitinophagaceae bacterium]